MKLVKKTHKNKSAVSNGDGGGSGGGDTVVDGGESERSMSNTGESSGRTVVVGVRLDQQSKELLTWALVKVAQPGDRVIALHVLHSSTNEEQSTLLSLVRTFDSVLAVYEGFCHLKQVDLKLKVCRGSSLRKILVREAKAFDSATVILGTCKVQHSIRSTTSVAKYCARKLSNDFSVFAVDNGKIVFQREASSSGKCAKSSHASDGPKLDSKEALEDHYAIVPVESNLESCDISEKHGSVPRKSMLIKRYFACAPISAWADHPCDDMEEIPPTDDREDNFLAMVPYKKPEASPGRSSTVDKERSESMTGWPLIRRAILPKQPEQPEADRAPSKKTSIVRRALKMTGRRSTMAVHPDRKRHNSAQMDDTSSDLSGESGAIVPFGEVTASAPCSPTHRSMPKELEGFHEKYSSACRLFTYQELLSATSEFAPDRMIGKGGSSQVYRGCLPDGKEIAVKILKPSDDVLQEFTAEIDIITTINHKNIISLLGFCLEDMKLVLVYDFLPRGSLEENLHGDGSNLKAFGWEERHKVALSVAEALDYLHNRDSKSVIHRDVKSSNILLSDEFEPQLADFGLATWASSVSTHLTPSDVAGTFGYLAPEYFMHGKVTDKMDVYAFGVVLLELISGRKPIDGNNPKGKESLVIWAHSVLKEEKISQILDPRLGGDYDHEQIEIMALAATLCIRRDPKLRPRMGSVLKLLQGDTEVVTWAKQQVNNYPLEFDTLDGEPSPTDILSHLNVALYGIVEDDSESLSITEPNTPISLEDYLRGRWSRSSSFD